MVGGSSCGRLVMVGVLWTGCDGGKAEPPRDGMAGDPDADSQDAVVDICASHVTFEMLPSQAVHSGNWSVSTSQTGEGEVSLLNQGMGTAGSVRYEPDIPCAGTWYIWVRAWENGSDDSYFVAIDGAPNPAEIYEAGCTADGSGYAWDLLNWRAPAGAPCTYVADPWAPTWTVGTHTIEFSYRESVVLGRILLTTDPALVPP